MGCNSLLWKLYPYIPSPTGHLLRLYDPYLLARYQDQNEQLDVFGGPTEVGRVLKPRDCHVSVL